MAQQLTAGGGSTPKRGGQQTRAITTRQEHPALDRDRDRHSLGALSVLLGHHHLFQAAQRHPDQASLIPWLHFQPTLVNWQNEFNALAGDQQGAHQQPDHLHRRGGRGCGMGTLAGYGLARYRFKRWGNANMTMWFLSQRFLPPIVTAIPSS